MLRSEPKISTYLRITAIVASLLLAVLAAAASAQTPSPALLVLEKNDNMMAIVDPATFKIVGRVPSGPDPHEIEASADGKLAYISNYGGGRRSFHPLSNVDGGAPEAAAPPSPR